MSADDSLAGKPGATTLAMRREGEHVVLLFEKPVMFVLLEPEQAFAAAEQMARDAHEAKFGQPAQTDGSYLGAQIRARVTEDMRDRMIQRATLVLGNLYERKYTPGRAAMEVVDTILNMAQGKTV